MSSGKKFVTQVLNGLPDDSTVEDMSGPIHPLLGWLVARVLRLVAQFDIFEFHASPCSKARAGRLDSCKKAWVVLQPIVEPFVFRLETDKNSRGLSVSSDDHVFFLSEPQISGEVVFDFRERYFFHSSSPNCSSHAAARDFGTMARTSTTPSDTS